MAAAILAVLWHEPSAMDLNKRLALTNKIADLSALTVPTIEDRISYCEYLESLAPYS